MENELLYSMAFFLCVIIYLGIDIMKYYILKEKEKDGYLSRTLCRINDEGIFEEYELISDFNKVLEIINNYYYE